ncbi:hypothetical protein [Streptacidiphilus rugosus]|uniref:hypothetical protein n=1 Tax=Streptacidiphilus rugosus TaxID=405783 RepID=UPI0012FC2282|nr:hypothetical protein [Streptacidiphilus rugosus]
MVYYFAAHSSAYPVDGEKTFVPAGLSITCFTDFGMKVDQTAAMMSLTRLTLKGQLAECQRETIPSGGEIENRTLKPLSEPEFRRLAGSAGSGTEIQTMGGDWVPLGGAAGVRLCLNPGPDGCKAPWHSCGGVFHYLQNKPGELRLICCRGTSGDSPLDQRIVTDDPNKITNVELSEVTVQYLDQMVEYVRGTPSKVDFFNGQFWEMPEKTRLLLQSYKEFQVSQRLYEAEALYEDSNKDEMRFFEFCTDNEGVGKAIEWELDNQPQSRQSVTTEFYVRGTGGMQCEPSVRQRAMDKHPRLVSLWNSIWYPEDTDSEDSSIPQGDDSDCD